MPSDFAKNLVKQFIKVYPFDAPVWDIGSGDVSYWYKPLFDGIEYVTVDPDPKYKSIVDHSFFVDDIPSRFDGSVGLVLLLETLEHVACPPCAMKSIFKLLRPGGWLLVSTVACHAIHQHPKDFWRFLPDGLELLFHQGGFINKGIKLSQPNTARSCSIAGVAQKPDK